MRCVYPDCPNTSRTRGLCHGHYQTMRQRVRKIGPAGPSLEKDLESRGLLLPKGQGGTPAPDSLGAFVLGSTVRGGSRPTVTEFAARLGIVKCREFACANPVDQRKRDGSDGIHCQEHSHHS